MNAFQKTRNNDSATRVMSSFRAFEKKLDRLQEDVMMHGSTLTELRVLMGSLAVALSSELPPEGRRPVRHSSRQDPRQAAVSVPTSSAATKNQAQKTMKRHLGKLVVTSSTSTKKNASARFRKADTSRKPIKGKPIKARLKNSK